MITDAASHLRTKSRILHLSVNQRGICGSPPRRTWLSKDHVDVVHKDGAILQSKLGFSRRSQAKITTFLQSGPLKPINMRFISVHILALAGLSIVANALTIHNNCPYTIYYSANQLNNTAHATHSQSLVSSIAVKAGASDATLQLSAETGLESEVEFTNSSQGGSGPLLFERVNQYGVIWWDLSEVLGFPFGDSSVTVTASDPTCSMITATCTKTGGNCYRNSEDDANGMNICPYGASFTITLCS